MILAFLKNILHERALSIFALVISAAAFLTSYQQLAEAKKQNKLSLKPIVTIQFNNLSEPDPKMGIIHIHNDGVGPATFTDVKIAYQSKVSQAQEVITWMNIFLHKGLDKEMNCIEFGALEGVTMGPNTDQFLVRFKSPEHKDFSRYQCGERQVINRINSLFQHVTITATYQSVYDEEFTAKTLSAFKMGDFLDNLKK